MFFRLAKRAGVPGLLSRLQFDWHSSGLLTVLWRELLGRMTARPGVEAGRQN
jgi:hypothetical protein